MISKAIKKKLKLHIIHYRGNGCSFIYNVEIYCLPFYPDHYITDGDLNGVKLGDGLLQIFFVGKTLNKGKAIAQCMTTETELLTNKDAVKKCIESIELSVSKIKS